MVRFRPDYLRRNQVPEIPSSIREIVSDPAFELGVADVRAGRSRRPGYDLWHVNLELEQIGENYERN
jgi:hypothetical protein